MPLRALILASLFCGAFALGRQPTARYPTRLSLLEGGGETGDGLTLNQTQSSASGCPSQLKGVMFNHIPKTGGSVFVKLLSAIFSEPTYAKSFLSGGPDPKHKPSAEAKYSLIIESDTANYKNTEDDMNQYFVIGLVRRPCDYMLSRWVQKCSTDTHDDFCSGKDQSHFKEFVTDSVGGTSEQTSPLMSSALADRYGKNLHCYVRMHELQADLLACVSKYEGCGGEVDHSHLSPDHLAAAMKDAAAVTHAAGRSVGDHEPCSKMFDADMKAAVLKTEQGVIDTYKLGDCCSSSN